MKRLVLLATVFALAAGHAVARVPDLQPPLHGDFDHYTLALTWQAGFCAENSCTPDTVRDVPIGLHGLWASLPTTLSDRGISNPQWWQKGCDYFQHSDASPSLPVAIRQTLSRIMPQTTHDLLRHEYDKHVQCFGFNQAAFFQTAIAMHDAIVDSSFARALVAQAGQQINRADLIAAFARDFRTDKPRALQLQCHVDYDGGTVLSQLWITIRRENTAQFPAPSSLMDSPVPQDNCPARFTVPTWN